MRRLLVVAVMVLAGCASVTEGTVYDKNFEPAHNENRKEAEYTTVCLPVSKTGTRTRYDGTLETYTYSDIECKQQFVGYRHYQVWIEDCYQLYFKDKDGHKGDACVSQWTYQEMQEGSYYKPKGS